MSVPGVGKTKQIFQDGDQMTQTSGGEKGKPKTLEEWVISNLGKYESSDVDYWLMEIARNAAKATIEYMGETTDNDWVNWDDNAKQWLGSESGK